MNAANVLAGNRVVPVVEIDDAANAVPLARALVEGGMPIIEVTLRTAAAKDAIRAIATEVPEMILGVGTVLHPEAVDDAVALAAAFLVSPGFSPSISAAAATAGIPLLPGVVTATEALHAAEHGHSVVKFFPAEASGGLPTLRALAAPLAPLGLSFMPTGGITPDTLATYLREPSVTAVGGTWIARRDAVSGKQFAAIRGLARAAQAIAASVSEESGS